VRWTRTRIAVLYLTWAAFAFILLVGVQLVALLSARLVSADVFINWFQIVVWRIAPALAAAIMWLGSWWWIRRKPSAWGASIVRWAPLLGIVSAATAVAGARAAVWTATSSWGAVPPDTAAEGLDLRVILTGAASMSGALLGVVLGPLVVVEVLQAGERRPTTGCR
jgi:hypothetical protein